MYVRPQLFFIKIINLIIMVSMNRKISLFIYNEWVVKSPSQRFFADSHTIDERVVRKIKKAAKSQDYIEYDMPISTLEKICLSRDLKLSAFFKLVENYTISK